MFTVLLADDEFIERDGLRYLISKGGYDVNILDAPNGVSALEIIRKESVDILISDIRMPIMDGLELSRFARSINPGIRILIYTAYSEFEYAQQAIEFNVSGYLLKPIQQERFYHELEKVLNESSALRAVVPRTHSTVRSCGERFERERLWFEWMHGWPYRMNGVGLKRMEELGIDPERMHLHLMQVSFEDAFFLSHVQTFEQLFEGQAEGLWVLDPSRALMLFSSPDALDDDRLLEAGRHLQRGIRERFGIAPSILIARPPRYTAVGGAPVESSVFEAFTLLDEQYATRLFEPGCVLLLNDKLMPRDDDLYDQLEQIRDGVRNLLMNNDVIGVRIRLDALMQFLDSVRDISALYLKNAITEISCDIISHMGMSNAEKRKTLDEIWRTNDKRSLIELLERYARMLEGAPSSDESDDTAIDRILDIIHNDYQSDLTREGIAARVYMTPSYVSYLFKQKMEKTLIKYLTCYRMERASKLLTGTNKSITEITALVGYDNASYFSSLFRTYFGQTPSSYRKSHGRRDK